MKFFILMYDVNVNQHASLLLHTEVIWLCRGKVFTRLIKLHSDVKLDEA